MYQSEIFDGFLYLLALNFSARLDILLLLRFYLLIILPNRWSILIAAYIFLYREFSEKCCKM